jgi:hypothetical protein
MNLIDLEIYAWIARYLRGAATVEEFEDWFVPATWDVDRSGNSAAREIADAVSGALVELSAGEIDDAHFKSELEALASKRTARIRIFTAFVSDQHEEPLSKTIKVEAPAAA